MKEKVFCSLLFWLVLSLFANSEVQAKSKRRIERVAHKPQMIKLVRQKRYKCYNKPGTYRRNGAKHSYNYICYAPKNEIKLSRRKHSTGKVKRQSNKTPNGNGRVATIKKVVLIGNKNNRTKAAKYSLSPAALAARINFNTSKNFAWAERKYRATRGLIAKRTPKGWHYVHEGRDIAPPNPGEKVPIENLSDGTFVSSAYQLKVRVTKKGKKIITGWGNHIRIKHTEGGLHECLMAHFDKRPRINPATKKLWKKGDPIPKGKFLGNTSTSGGTRGAHCHIESRKILANGKLGPIVDPAKFHPELLKLKKKY